MKKLSLLIVVGVSSMTLARPGFRFRSSPSRMGGYQKSGSLSEVGASNIDDRKAKKVDHFFPHYPSSNKPQTSGSLSGVGASNIDSPRPRRRGSPNR